MSVTSKRTFQKTRQTGCKLDPFGSGLEKLTDFC
jgi:hypothetical protein